MEILPVLRMLGALGVVLGLLVGALWAVRRFQIRLPGVGGTGGPGKRLELVERVSMDTRRSVALIRRDGREHLLLLAPEGNMVIEAGIQLDETDREAARIRAEQAEQAAAEAIEAAERARAEFRAMVDKASDRFGEVRRGARQRIAGSLVEVRENARKATRKAAEKAREAAERRRQGAAARVEDFGPAEAAPAVDPAESVAEPVSEPVDPIAAEAAPQAEGLFAGLVDDAQARTGRKSRRRRQPRTDKMDGE
jgi:flagellar biogenesis protein FliO